MHAHSRQLCRCLAPWLLAICAASAQANLVSNGDFETGDFSAWSALGIPNGQSVSSVNPHAGQYTAHFGSATANGITQLVSTEAGAEYTVSFWVRVDGPADNDFVFDWDGGAPENSLHDINPGFASFSYQLTASSSQTAVSFLFREGDGGWQLDDVVVEKSTRDLPLPGSLSLLALGLPSVVCRRRRGR